MKIICVKVFDLTQPKAGTSCKQNDLAKLWFSAHTNGPEHSAPTIYGAGISNRQSVPAQPVTNCADMNNHHHTAQPVKQKFRQASGRMLIKSLGFIY